MKTVITAAATGALLLVSGSGSYGHQPRAQAPAAAAAACSGQVVPNSSFERGATGWTAGPRIVVLGDQARPAHTGRAYAALGGLDVTRTDLLRTTVTVPAGCTLTLSYWVRVSTTETTRGDSLNIGLAVAGTPPKTILSLAYDHPKEWTQHTTGAWPAGATDRATTISFLGSESANPGVTAFDVDDVRLTLG